VFGVQDSGLRTLPIHLAATSDRFARIVNLWFRQLMISGRESGWCPQQWARFPLLLKLTEVPLLLRDVPLSTFVSVGSAL